MNTSRKARQVALNKGIAIGNVVSYDFVADQITVEMGDKIQLLAQPQPAFVRLELRTAGYKGWDVPLIDAYARVFRLLKALPTSPTIIAEITAQSVPGSSQAAWNAGHSEPAAPGPVVTPFTGLFTTIVGEILRYVQRAGDLMPEHRLRCDGMAQHLYLHLDGQNPVDQRMRSGPAAVPPA